ncbi:quinonoid dihydropteridine reductase [Novymonas esmeraldas]|uniref:Dihydropteridine reductase n=1 Tax=Novymonas esmeraldas TaxID=1808958 RepID=A0AAW0EWH0_9TRYP
MRNVLLIGARGSLGRAATSAFAKRDWSVIAVDQVGAVEPGDSCRAVDPASSIEQLQRAYLEAVAGLKLHAVINVAGGWAGGSVADASTAAAAELMLRQSLFSSVAAAHVFATHGERGGLLLFTGAAAAAAGPTPGMLGYGVAKAAVHALCQSVAADASLLPSAATVLTILPATLDTPGNRGAMPDADRSSWTPLDDVARRIVEWSSGEGRPASGSLVRVVTERAQTRFIA